MAALPTPEPDHVGDLSIIVQGGLSIETAVPIANAMQHWRTLFPASEIILSLSGSNMLAIEADPGDQILTPALLPSLRSDTRLVAAIDRIIDDTDRIVVDTRGLPLPSIKSDTILPNNINLQIAAAQAGLRHATGRYVLRVRSDLLFLDRGFLDQYAALADLPRGDAATLHQRVLISWLYTLNPYGLERMPFHFSDWFHFGLREDVSALWNVPFMTLADATHHRVHPHSAGANARERLFHMRLADEQHLAWHAVAARSGAASPPDPDDAAAALAILADDFVLCDLAAAHCVFPKYQAELHNPEKRHACLTPGDWRRLVEARHASPAMVLSEKIQDGISGLAAERRRSFPRRYTVPKLGTQSGTIVGTVIVSDGPGTVVIGPYAALPPGDYRAVLEATGWEGAGTVTLRATLGAGEVLLAERSVPVDAAAPPVLDLTFRITTNDAADFELVCSVTDLRLLAVSGLTLARDGDDARDAPLPRLLLSSIDRSGVAASSCALRCGRYFLALDAMLLAAGDVCLEVVGADGATIARINQALTNQNALSAVRLAFDIVRPGISPVTLRCRTKAGMLDLRHLLVARRIDESGLPLVPRFYDPLDLSTECGRYDGDWLTGQGDGILCYGPYVALPRGRYQARVHLQHPVDSGSVRVAVKAGGGRDTLAAADFTIGSGEFLIPFQVETDMASRLEVVCTIKSVPHIAISGIILEPGSVNAFPQDPSPGLFKRLLSSR
jgi:hypothetical protein